MSDEQHINDAGLALIKKSEGVRLDAYQDSVGVWTIGYGHTHGVHPGQRITHEQAEAFLRQDIEKVAEKPVNDMVEVDLTDNQFSALCSFVFNLGSGTLEKSTLLKKLNAGDYAAVPAELLKFNHAGEKVLNGLTKRRQAEADLWNT